LLINLFKLENSEILCLQTRQLTL